MNFLETENVVKQYAGHLALNKVSIQVPQGARKTSTRSVTCRKREGCIKR